MAARKPAVKDWLEIQSDFECMEAMKCVPIGIGKVSADHVFDENQSVKWNREQVNINNARYLQEVARLNTEKNKARDAIYEDIYRAIQAEVGHNLSRKKTNHLFHIYFSQIIESYNITQQEKKLGYIFVHQVFKVMLCFFR